jgi:hypothetical protein
MAEFHYAVSLHPNQINIFKRVIPGTIGKSKRQIQPNLEFYEEEAKEKKKIVFNVDDKLSALSQKKLKRSLTYIDCISSNKKAHLQNRPLPINFKLTFLTLTLSDKQSHSDQFIRRHMLNDFFNRARIKWSLEHYVWRAEKQKNGNIHFHIVTNVFIPHYELRDTWNQIQRKLGYLDKYKLEHGHYRANSTDIHSLQFVKNIGAYLIKYLVKDEQNKGLSGRLYGSSKSLSNIKGCVTDIDSDLSAELSKISSHKTVRKVKGDYYECFFFDIKLLKSNPNLYIVQLLNEYFLSTWHVSFIT